MQREQGTDRQLLQGIRVLDLSRVMAGPYCTSMLADLGADVIKVEMPGMGDTGRHFAPFKDGESTYFMLLNRGKKSVTIDLKPEAGRQLIKDLIRHSDVLVENFRPGVMARLGLDYEAVKALNERIIYASISGFGQDSPLKDQPALDLVIQAMSGLMSLTGPRDGAPTCVGESVADLAAGIFAAWGIMAALFDRERTGRGRYLDISMLDSLFSMLLTSLSRKLYFDETPQRVGNRHPETYPVDAFPTKTGDIVLVGFSDKVFRRLAALMGRPELGDDPRFQDNAARNENEDELRQLILEWSSSLTAEEALAQLREASIPCAPIWSISDVVASSHVQSRGLITKGRHRKFGDVPLVAQPVKFSGNAPPSGQITPMLGEHTEHVLRGVLHLDDEALRRLRDENVI